MKNYDPKRIVATWKAIAIVGYATGTFLQAERDNDTFTTEAGAQGDVVRTKSHDRRGKVTFTLQSTSPANDLLSVFALAGEEGNSVDADVGALLVKDLNGTTLLAAEEAWISKPPSVEYADTHQPRQWVLHCANLKMFVGGALR